MAKVQLDTVNSDSSEFVIWLKQAKITTKVIDECGPGGGWPIVEYQGRKKALQVMIIKWWDDASLCNEIKI